MKTIKTSTNKYSNNNDNAKVKSITVQNLELSKTPYDCDLIRLVPSNADQSWKIKLELYFSEILISTILILRNEAIKGPFKDMENNSVLRSNKKNRIKHKF